MTDFVARLQGVQLDYGKTRALAGVDLQLPAGCMVRRSCRWSVSGGKKASAAVWLPYPSSIPSIGVAAICRRR